MFSAKMHFLSKVSKGAKIRNRNNQVPHLTQDTNGKVTNSQLDTANESKKVSSFPAGDHEAHINRRTQRHSKLKTEKTHKRSTKEVPPWNGQLILYWRASTGLTAPTSPLIQIWIKTLRYLICMKDPLLINASSPKTIKSRYNKEIKQRYGLNSK